VPVRPIIVPRNEQDNVTDEKGNMASMGKSQRGGSSFSPGSPGEKNGIC